MKKFVPVLIMALFISACQKQDTTYTLQGHWLDLNNLQENGIFDAMDITDSTSLSFRNKLHPPREVSLWWKDSVFLPFDHIHYSPFWKLKKDKLVIYDDEEKLDSVTYTRITDNRFWKEGYLKPLRVKINLSDWSDQYDLSRKESVRGGTYCDIFLGYPKNPKISSEALLFVNDVFIGFDDVDQFLSIERDKLDEGKRNELKVLVHIDTAVSSVKSEKLFKVLKKQQEPVTIFKGGISEKVKDLVYRRLAEQ